MQLVLLTFQISFRVTPTAYLGRRKISGEYHLFESCASDRTHRLAITRLPIMRKSCATMTLNSKMGLASRVRSGPRILLALIFPHPPQ